MIVSERFLQKERENNVDKKRNHGVPSSSMRHEIGIQKRMSSVILQSVNFKDGAYYCYCPYVLRNFFYLQGGRLFEVGAYSRLGAYYQINTVTED